MANECVIQQIGSQTCVVCTGQPEIRGVPEHVIDVPDLAWNAGADLLAGPFAANCELYFSVGQCGGIVTGLTQTPRPRSFPFDVSDYRYAWYTTTINNVKLAQPIEAGLPIDLDPITINSDSVLKIQRVGRVISYYIDAELIHVSGVRSTGDLYAGSSSYASGDTVA